ncbi:arginase family protein [Bradyrhizobium sp. U87765 SZCCT0131]|uniref:arginase family protein n=1 Tax=unclassified Bradyrhizobium TaxID=2631580 RepID=UPI001BA68129|nr:MULTISPECIES: arginase family protein [unclassified Bradyrhizobium]MBR1221524.1 arginase family protein [Bradyrhizobium sp. U87765 SZCCT0131]MBR1264553.1 arginase family protein [Bradyrhizobium sp. U87765 SZCCT0134]MBR1304541.1 arginase family protein [Bradyrhizobium sp. U87765 SZCCT0110]MBR1322602.1 arginase family protein [Bradyrhizobium sp. U87765 SZCCT0109]MBR1346470.1 arginase family protein [Bradyrhizobium sp. U87765 SZCCT0048]
MSAVLNGALDAVAPLTFMGAPYAPVLPAGSRVVVAGVPFDGGQHATRLGSRLGPRSVREQSLQLRAVDPEADLDVLAALGLVDVGDVRVTHGDLDASQRSVVDFAGALVNAGALPVMIGGDGSITLPLLEAVWRRHPGLAVVHLDAHTDAYPLAGNVGPAAFHRAAEAGLLEPAASFHIGLRGPVAATGLYAHARQLGYQLVTVAELLERGIASVLDDVHRRIGDRPTYICWDMDVFDPTVAPGVITPSWDGITAREGLQIARLLRRLNIVAIDVNCVSPVHDAAGLAAFLCARIIFEFLAGLAISRRPPGRL